MISPSRILHSQFRTDGERTAVLFAAVSGPLIAFLSLNAFNLAVGYIGAVIFFAFSYFHMKFVLTALLIYMPFMHVLPNIQLATGINLFNIMMLLLLGAWGISVSRENISLKFPEYLGRPIVYFVAISFVSFFIGFANSGMDMGYFIDKLTNLWQWLSVMILPFVIANSIRTHGSVIFYLTVISLIVLVVALHAINEHNVVMAGTTGYSNDLRIGGVFGKGGENDLGALFAEFLMVPLLLIIVLRGYFSKLTFAVLLGPIFLALLYTYSRGAWMGTALGFVVYIFTGNRKLLPVFAVLIVLLPAAAPESVVERVNMTQSEDDGKLEDSASSRLEFWKSGVHMLMDHPLTGVGFRRFSVELDNYMSVAEGEARTPHNQFVSIFSEMGIPGFILFMWLLGAMVYHGLLMIRDSSPFVKQSGSIFLAMMAVMFMVNMFGVRFIRAELTGLFWFVTGLMISIYDIRTADNIKLNDPTGSKEG